MAIVKKVDIKLQTDIDTTIKYQIMTYCFFADILISNSDLKFLMSIASSFSDPVITGKVYDFPLNSIFADLSIYRCLCKFKLPAVKKKIK